MAGRGEGYAISTLQVLTCGFHVLAACEYIVWWVLILVDVVSDLKKDMYMSSRLRLIGDQTTHLIYDSHCIAECHTYDPLL